MNDKQRLQLQNMIKENNVEDQTDFIRSLKHSQIIRNEVNNMILIKAKFSFFLRFIIGRLASGTGTRCAGR